MEVLSSLGMRPIINAATSLTRLGGSIMPPKVVAAMQEVAGAYIDLHEFQDRVGERLAELTRNEAAWVSSGAAAGLVLSILGCRTRGDERLISRLPQHPSLGSNVLMFSAHRNPYDRLVGLAGCKIQSVGDVKQTFPYELEAALDEQPVALLYVVGNRMPNGVLPLAQTVELAHERNVPVIVDAAAQLPPKENLWRFSKEEGADFVVFSGGKQLRGPQGSGLVVGTTEAIRWIKPNAAPYQRFARALKISKEEIAGLLAAVQLFVSEDASERYERAHDICISWQKLLSTFSGIDVSVEPRNAAGADLPRVRIRLLGDLVLLRETLVTALWNRTPRIAVLANEPGSIFLEPDLMRDEETLIVAQALDEEFDRVTARL